MPWIRRVHAEIRSALGLHGFAEEDRRDISEIVLESRIARLHWTDDHWRAEATRLRNAVEGPVSVLKTVEALAGEQKMLDEISKGLLIGRIHDAVREVADMEEDPELNPVPEERDMEPSTKPRPPREEPVVVTQEDLEELVGDAMLARPLLSFAYVTREQLKVHPQAKSIRQVVTCLERHYNRTKEYWILETDKSLRDIYEREQNDMFCVLYGEPWLLFQREA